MKKILIISLSLLFIIVAGSVFAIFSVGVGSFFYQDKQLPHIKPTIQPTQTNPEYLCETIKELPDFQYCTCSNNFPKAFDYITGPNSMKIENVSNYSISPNKKWMFVVTYSQEFVLSGGAPAENAIQMVDIENQRVYELITKIFFPNFTEESWSPEGNSLVLTAGTFTLNGKEYVGEPYIVLSCSTSCQVIAEDAGPPGIGADPAYYFNGKIHYTVYEEDIYPSI